MDQAGGCLLLSAVTSPSPLLSCSSALRYLLTLSTALSSPLFLLYSPSPLSPHLPLLLLSSSPKSPTPLLRPLIPLSLCSPAPRRLSLSLPPSHPLSSCSYALRRLLLLSSALSSPLLLLSSLASPLSSHPPLLCHLLPFSSCSHALRHLLQPLIPFSPALLLSSSLPSLSPSHLPLLMLSYSPPHYPPLFHPLIPFGDSAKSDCV